MICNLYNNSQATPLPLKAFLCLYFLANKRSCKKSPAICIHAVIMPVPGAIFLHSVRTPWFQRECPNICCLCMTRAILCFTMQYLYLHAVKTYHLLGRVIGFRSHSISRGSRRVSSARMILASMSSPPSRRAVRQY